MINWVLVVALGHRRVREDRTGAARSRRTSIELFLEAYQIYYDSYYFVLNLPFP